MKQTTLITIIMVALVFTGCKSDSDPKCDCPNGTVHLVGETCCDYDDCVCEKNVAGKRVDGIAVTKGEGLSDTDFNDMCKAVGDGLDRIATEENGQYAYMLPIIKKHIAEIRILPGPQTNVPSVSQENGRNVLLVEKGYSADDIGNALYEWVQANPELK